MIKEIRIKNYKSIRDATVKLSPFTLLVGANGTGKSNLLKLLQALSTPKGQTRTKTGRYVNQYHLAQSKHFSHLEDSQAIEVESEDNILVINNDVPTDTTIISELGDTRVFSLVPQTAGNREELKPKPQVEPDGQGIVRVLDALKTGDREDLFNKIESILKEQVPEVEKLSFLPSVSTKQLQVRERCIPKPVKVSELSEGTQLALQIITILHQERKPSLICIEDIDKGLHPRLFQKIVQLCFELTAEDDSIQIIATTHNPYLVDEFKGHESAVVIVEKTNGETTFTTLEDKLQNLDPGEEPLGSLWYSGFVGGVPQGV